jgi:thiamine biosynthesis protein ThiI
MMKRGCQVAFVHFHSFPLVDRSSIEKAVELAEMLTRYQYRSQLYLVPFAPVQKRILVSMPPAHRIVLYRRFMLRIAEALARREGARALVTGDSLGQVSSQTLDNMATIQAAVTMPVLRPLIGMDKQEIMAQAQRLGTYAVSILPDQDCCSLFVPRHPALHASLEEVAGLEGQLDVPGLVAECLAGAEAREFKFPKAPL